ncbi:MAG: hypothetical protein MJB14_16750, partial [Spirochaetes bacterium]|nr:hypothetical protein [Spirochaetota bacterium]
MLLTSATMICIQVLFTRIFSLLHWQNLSAIIISVALCGFGISGTALLFLKKQLSKNFEKLLSLLLLLYPIGQLLALLILFQLPINPFTIGIEPIQLVNIGIHIIILLIPFLLAALIIGMILLKEKTNQAYFFNLFGSGIGAFSSTVLLTKVSPFLLFGFIILFSLLIWFIYQVNQFNSLKLVKGLFILLISTFTLFFCNQFSTNWLSEYKDLSRSLLLPESKIIATKQTPAGMIHLLATQGLRISPGLSLLCPYSVPEQSVIYLNGNTYGGIIPFDNDLTKLSFFDYLPVSLGYQMIHQEQRSNCLILGASGGSGIL